MEDEKATRKLLRNLLEERGCDVDEAVDGQQAINLLDRHDYAVVLLDIVLPRISGTAVMELLLQAIVQINSPGHRAVQTHPNVPRRLRRVVFTNPSNASST